MDSESPILSMAGEKVAIGPFRRDAIPLLQRWFNDLDVMVPFEFHDIRPATREAVEKVYDDLVKAEDRCDFLIYEMSTPRPIGLTNLHRIVFAQRIAEFGVLIGEKDCWGKGYGTEATRLILRYAFDVLSLNSVLLSAFAYNERALGAYRRAGFREVGRWRQAHWMAGRAYDVVFMDCLASEFARTG